MCFKAKLLKTWGGGSSVVLLHKARQYTKSNPLLKTTEMFFLRQFDGRGTRNLSIVSCKAKSCPPV